MKSSQKEIFERRDKIFNELLNNDEVYVSDLAQLLNVSDLTIRRDLMFFEQKKYIERFYGGAKLLSKHDEQSLSQKINKIKHEIAKKAASMIDSGDTIFINTSSTALLVLRYLEDKEVTVITNNARAVFIKTSPNVSIILSGGELRNPKESMVGDFAIQALNMVTVSKAVLGCSGFTLEQGMTTSIHSEVMINQIMLQNCKGPRIVVADHTKLGNDASFISGSIHDIDILITDKDNNKEILEQLSESRNINVIVI
ncbi:MAG TPA: DeoR/GlpR transcriptional regulator [Erysipelothrix sp.]|nr:DeoR/GlpR transcriptional regulator [Erysipelothrix sp.]